MDTTTTVDLIDTDVKTVAEVKAAKKSQRQDNLATIVTKLEGFTGDEIIDYPISVVLSLHRQATRIKDEYITALNSLREVSNAQD